MNQCKQVECDNFKKDSLGYPFLLGNKTMNDEINLIFNRDGVVGYSVFPESVWFFMEHLDKNKDLIFIIIP